MPTLVMRGEQVGEDGTGYGVPSARYGARNYGERVGGGEESGGEICGETSVLHADLDGDCTVFRLGETEYASDKKA